MLARLGLLGSMPACTDTTGGCLASQYLAAWVIERAAGEAAARAVVGYVAPVGERDETVRRVLATIRAAAAASH